MPSLGVCPVGAQERALEELAHDLHVLMEPPLAEVVFHFVLDLLGLRRRRAREAQADHSGEDEALACHGITPCLGRLSFAVNRASAYSRTAAQRWTVCRCTSSSRSRRRVISCWR